MLRLRVPSFGIWIVPLPMSLQALARGLPSEIGDFFKKSHGWIVKDTKDMECP